MTKQQVYFVCPSCGKKEFLPGIFEEPELGSEGTRWITYQHCIDCLRQPGSVHVSIPVPSAASSRGFASGS